jgi:tetratricopeptide (TPR) repeat protein
MPSSQKTTIKNEKLSTDEVVKILAQVLAKAKKFAGPALLMVEFPTEYTRRETAEKLEKELKKVDDELVNIDLRKPINLLEVIEGLKLNQVGSVHGLHAQPEVVRRLNWGRERLTDKNKRIVFWLNFEELKDLAERAPDFWAFRNRQLVLSEYDGKIHLPEPDFYSANVLELSNLSLESKQNRAEALEELLKGVKDFSSPRAINIRHSLGLLYSNLGQYQKALEHLSKILEISQKTGDKQEEGSILNEIGSIYIRLGEFSKAIEYLAQALDISRQMSDQNKEAVRLGNLGIAFARLGEFDRAADFYEESIALSELTGNTLVQRDGLGNLANLYAQSGQFTLAIELYEKTLRISRQTEDKRGESNNLGNMGLAHQGLGNFREAIYYHEQALAISREIGNKHGESNALGNLGNAYSSQGENEKALHYYKQSLKICREIGNKAGEVDDLGNMGLHYAEFDENTKALACLTVALNIAVSIGYGNVNRLLNYLSVIRSRQSKFESLLRSLFPDGDKILQEATDQSYKFFRNAPADIADEIITVLDDFEKQKKTSGLLYLPVRDKSSKFRVI